MPWQSIEQQKITSQSFYYAYDSERLEGWQNTAGKVCHCSTISETSAVVVQLAIDGWITQLGHMSGPSIFLTWYLPSVEYLRWFLHSHVWHLSWDHWSKWGLAYISLSTHILSAWPVWTFLQPVHGWLWTFLGSNNSALLHSWWSCSMFYIILCLLHPINITLNSILHWILKSTLIQRTLKTTTKEKWAKDLNRPLTKEDIQMAHKCMKRCSTLYVFIEVQIKTTMGHYHMPIWMAKIWNISNTNAGKDVE